MNMRAFRSRFEPESRSTTRVSFRERMEQRRQGGKLTRDDEAIIGRMSSVASVVQFRAEADCLRTGGKITNFDDMMAATVRVLKKDPGLASRYYEDCMSPATDAELEEVGL